MYIFFLVILIICLYIVWQRQELERFGVTNYKIVSSKIKENVKGLVLADLHHFSYGNHNGRLLQVIEEEKPDMIFIPGDFIVTCEVEKYDESLQLLEKLRKIAPVYYSFGNHESRARESVNEETREAFQNFYRKAKKNGIYFLENEKTLKFHNWMTIYGLELPLSYYVRGKKIPLPYKELKKYLPENKENTGYQVMLAHNPMYGKSYQEHGVDLVLSGHMHGGLVRLPFVGSILSPQFQLFPKYSGGKYQLGRTTLIVSRGMGTHTFHIRVCNRAELVCIHFEKD